MTSTGRLLQLTDLIQEKVKEFETYRLEKGLPDPSFDESYPPSFDLPPREDQARKIALEAIDELKSHLLGPLGILYDDVCKRTERISLQGITYFNLAKSLPPKTNTTIPALAQKCGIHPSDAETLINDALTRQLFLRNPDGSISHSAKTRALTTVPNLHALVRFALTHMHGADPFVVPAMEKWPGSQEPHETGWNLGYAKEDPFFVEIGKDARQSQDFADAMRCFTQTPQMNVEHAVRGYAWGEHAHGTVVDVGGSQGAVMERVKTEFPDVNVIVQDREEVVASAPAAVAAKVEFQAHDFFTEQPVKGADVYFFRWIFHDWSDGYCVAILRALVPALRRGSRVVIMDDVTPEPGEVSFYQERAIREMDLIMKALFNAKERSESEWKRLLNEADARFELCEVRRPVGSQLCIIVVEWTGAGARC